MLYKRTLLVIHVKYDAVLKNSISQSSFLKSGMEVVDMKVQRSWRHKFMVLEWHPDSVGITSTDGRRNKQVTHEIFRTSLGIKKHSIFCYKVHRTDQSNHTLCRLNVFSVLSLCVILMSNFLWSPGTQFFQQWEGWEEHRAIQPGETSRRK